MQIGRHIVVTGYEHPAEEDELLKYWQELSHTSWFQDHPLLQAPSLQDIQIIRISSLLCAGSRGYRSEILYTIEGIWRRGRVYEPQGLIGSWVMRAVCDALMSAVAHAGNQNFECFALLAPMAPSSTMLSRFLCLGSCIGTVPVHDDTVNACTLYLGSVA